MRRFFFDSDTINDGELTLPESEAHHVIKVLRLKAGDEIECLDGSGRVFRARLTVLGAKQVQARIVKVIEQTEPVGTRLVVWQAVLKGEKMDAVVQKCTELGVAEVVPFWSSRCQGKLEPRQMAKKLERWQRIALEACKQSKRTVPMIIAEPTLLEQAAVARRPPGDGLVFWEEEQTTRLAQLGLGPELDQVDILLGPEGGLSSDEVASLQARGWQTVSLGARILRAETATLTAVSLLQYLTGNL